MQIIPCDDKQGQKQQEQQIQIPAFLCICESDYKVTTEQMNEWMDGLVIDRQTYLSAETINLIKIAFNM